ncbi:4980_t:CDS:2, partial [Acaulospora colombiana]
VGRVGSDARESYRTPGADRWVGEFPLWLKLGIPGEAGGERLLAGRLPTLPERTSLLGRCAAFAVPSPAVAVSAETRDEENDSLGCAKTEGLVVDDVESFLDFFVKREGLEGEIGVVGEGGEVDVDILRSCRGGTPIGSVGVIANSPWSLRLWVSWVNRSSRLVRNSEVGGCLDGG